jgi:hypothetical protein
MSDYFNLLSAELMGKLAQVKVYINKHNPTIGVLTEEILRSFLSDHLPKAISVAQGFVANENGAISRQCDIILYDSHHYAPLYKANDIVVVPVESVLAVIEVKTTINKSIFHHTIRYFKALSELGDVSTHLFIYNSRSISHINRYFQTYKHEGGHQSFDHDTFQFLPDTITGINTSFHLKKSAVITDSDMLGYMSWFYKDAEATEINALQHFYLSMYGLVEDYMSRVFKVGRLPARASYHQMEAKSASAIGLFDI